MHESTQVEMDDDQGNPCYVHHASIASKNSTQGQSQEPRSLLCGLIPALKEHEEQNTNQENSRDGINAVCVKVHKRQDRPLRCYNDISH